MSPWELATGAGKDRVAACVFKVPVDERMVTMCEVNLTGVREAVDLRKTPLLQAGVLS